MIIAPFKNIEKLNGFIHKYHIDYAVNASSTNVNETRITNPFTSASDRWCSQSNEKTGEWLMINFTHRSLYISHFVLWSVNDDFRPISWYAEGCNEESCYNLTIYNDSTIDTKQAFKPKVHGPFKSFKMISTGMTNSQTYHLCAYKLEFYGSTSDAIERRCTCMAINRTQNKIIILMLVIISK